MVENEIEKCSVLRVTEQESCRIEDSLVREFLLTIILNNRELVTLLCSPGDLKYLAVGFLAAEGLLKSKDEITKILVDARRGVVRVETKTDFSSDLLFKRLITSGCGRGTSLYGAADAQGQIHKVDSQASLPIVKIFSLVTEFQQRSLVFRTTGGVHSAALCGNDGILIFNEDIGRHNAIDKIFGECILKDIPTSDCIVITSGRISSEILLKVAKRNISMLISKSAPTNLGRNLANELGVTLIGFVRGQRMNVYANDWRIIKG